MTPRPFLLMSAGSYAMLTFTGMFGLMFQPPDSPLWAIVAEHRVETVLLVFIGPAPVALVFAGLVIAAIKLPKYDGRARRAAYLRKHYPGDYS